MQPYFIAMRRAAGAGLLALPITFVLTISTSLLFSTSLQAQTMFRCGSNYQDKPCANGQVGKVIGTQKSAATEVEAKAVIDPVCLRRSEDAKKIIWLRQGGAAKDDVMAKMESGEQQRLVNEVYATRGDTPQMRAAIEKRCMDERGFAKRPENMSDAELLGTVRALEKRLNAAEKADAARVPAAEQEAPAAKRKLPCPNIKMQLDIVNNSLRAGGNAQEMQQLKQQKRELEKDLVAGVCK
jgi:hypothetical protein